MAIAVYPGSFDPITLGHIDIVQRLSSHYDKMVVLVADSPKKSYLFSSIERARLIKDSLKVENVRVDIFVGLTVDYAQKIGARFIIRGLRAVADFEYEMAMANINKSLYPDIETMIVFANPKFGHLSSRMVKEVAYFNGPLDGLVPNHVAKALMEEVKKERN